MIYLFGVEAIALAIVVIAAIMYGTFEYLMGLFNTLWIIFAVSSFTQTVIIGCFRQKNSLKSTLCLLTVDMARITLYFTTLKIIGAQVQSQGGLGKIFSVFIFLIYFTYMCIPFVLGELCTFLHTTKSESFSLWLSLSMFFIIAIGAIIGFIL